MQGSICYAYHGVACCRTCFVLSFQVAGICSDVVGASVAAAYTAASADAPAVITSVEVTEVPITTTAGKCILPASQMW